MSLLKRHDSGYGYYGNTSGLSNACKTILANIRFMDVDKPVCSIVITSAVPNEGKSFVAENLCRAIASSGKTVLLVEADMRRSTLAGRLKAHAKHGIYSVLSGAVTFDKAFVATDMPNMYFLDAEPGIPNPSDLLNSRQFERFVPIACSAFDYVVFDTPPVGAFVDAAVLGRLVDATFIVVREDFARREQVAAAYDQLVKAGANVAGVIIPITITTPATTTITRATAPARAASAATTARGCSVVCAGSPRRTLRRVSAGARPSRLRAACLPLARSQRASSSAAPQSVRHKARMRQRVMRLRLLRRRGAPRRCTCTTRTSRRLICATSTAIFCLGLTTGLATSMSRWQCCRPPVRLA